MGSINVSIFEGHIGQEPTLKEFDSGSAVCDLRVAIKVGWGDREHTRWENVKIWGALAPIVAQLPVGQRVYIKGELDAEEWETAEGQKRVKLFTTVGRGGGISWDSPREQRSERTQSDDNEPPPIEAEDIPF